MAGSVFDLSLFRARVTDRLTLDHIDLFPIDRDGVSESLPRATLFRTADLLNVRLSFVGLALENGPDGRILRRADDAEVGYLRVLFGGQHLHERAFFEITTGVGVETPGSFAEDPVRPPDPDATSGPDPLLPPPVQTRIAGGSRLVFRVSDELVPFTLDGLLAAIGTLPLSVAPHAVRHPLFMGAVISIGHLVALDVHALEGVGVSGAVRSASRMLGSAAALQARFGAVAAASALVAAHTGAGTFRLGEEAASRLGQVVLDRLIIPAVRPAAPRQPSPTETAIELPWRLQLSPHEGAGFGHARAAAASADGRVEVWHTRLGSRTDGGVDESPRDDRTVRAVWARDFDETPGFTFHATPPGGAVKEFPEADQSQDVPRWRSPLNSRDRMMLVHETSNFRLFGPDGLTRYTPPSVEVDRLMLSALGGWLASSFETTPPKGATTIEEWVHRAALGRDGYVKVVYAGFLLPFLQPASLVKVTERKVRNGIAYLFQRMYVVVRDPLRSYGATGETVGGRRVDLGMPFTSVRILTPATPDIEPPTDLTPGIGGLMFTPVVGGVPFRFRMLGVDLDGRLVEFDGPLVFAEYDHNQDGATVAQTVTAYSGAIPSFDVRGQKVAFAPSATADDTSLATRTMAFDVVTTPGMLGRPQNQARLEPMLRTASTIVPAMSALAGANAAVTVQYPAAYLEKQFVGNAAEVFLELASPAALDFTTQSDRSGGFVAPSLNVTALSRMLGPVGGPVSALVAGGPGFDVASFFPTSAKLFGLVSLGELLPKGFGEGALPRFLAQSFDAATMLTTNLERMVAIAGRLSSAPVAAALATRLQAVADAASALLGTVAVLADTADATPVADKLASIEAAIPPLKTAIAEASTELAATDSLLRSDREALVATTDRVLDQLGDTAAESGALLEILRLAAAGATLPETVRARLDWSADLNPWPASAPIFAPRGGVGKLTLVVDVQAPTKPGAQPSALVSCAISAFDLRLIGDDPFITLSFEKLEFSAVPGRKTDVNVVFTEGSGVVFGGPLAFVETLRSIIPFDGFSDPPSLDVSPAGIKAGFDLPIPTVAMGVFALSNITFSAAFEVPFIGESIAVRFAFSSRENPFRLQVAFFAGGGFFAIVITPKEVRELEAALEFGAALSLDFGVASGSVSVMAGIYFRLRTENGVTNAQLTGYFRARGEVDVLGLITASIEIYLELTYETASGKAVGRASISIEVSVCLLSFSVSVSCEKKFAGDSGDPTFDEVMGVHPLAVPGTPRPWDEYCDAFAD